MRYLMSKNEWGSKERAPRPPQLSEATDFHRPDEWGARTKYLMSTDEWGARARYLMSTDEWEGEERPPRLPDAHGREGGLSESTGSCCFQLLVVAKLLVVGTSRRRGGWVGRRPPGSTNRGEDP